MEAIQCERNEPRMIGRLLCFLRPMPRGRQHGAPSIITLGGMLISASLIGLATPGTASHHFEHEWNWEAPIDLNGTFVTQITAAADGVVNNPQCLISATGLGQRDGEPDPPIYFWVDYRTGNDSGWWAFKRGGLAHAHVGPAESTEFLYKDIFEWGAGAAWWTDMSNNITITIAGFDVQAIGSLPGLTVRIACHHPFRISTEASRNLTGFTDASLGGGVGLGAAAVGSSIDVAVADSKSFIFPTESVIFRVRDETRSNSGLDPVGTLTLHHPEGQEEWTLSGSDAIDFRGGPGAYGLGLNRFAFSANPMGLVEHEDRRPGLVGLLAGLNSVTSLDQSV